MTLRIHDVLYWGIYSAACRLANIESFVSLVSNHVDLQLESTPQAAMDALRDLAHSIRPTDAIDDQHKATDLLVSDDLLTISNLQIDDTCAPPEERVRTGGEAIRERLMARGLDISDVHPVVVDEFPPPFNQFGWAAFAPDGEDRERYGIAPGVYFRRDHLRPLYSEALLAHELVHTIPGGVDPQVYAMGLEEGLAEVLGTCHAAAGVLPQHVLTNILTYGRHGMGRPRLWTLYRDHTRQAFLLYREFGLSGIVALLRAGRQRIHQAETAILAGTHRSLPLPRGDWCPETDALLESFCCGYLPSHVFDPLGCVLLDHVAEGRTLGDTCRSANVPKDCGIPVLRRLGAESALFVTAGDTVGYSNVEHYAETTRMTSIPIIRYLPTTTNPVAEDSPS